MIECEPDCSLCFAISKTGQQYKENAILFETTNFVAIPSIGPLSIGHILIVSKPHIASLSQMGLEKIQEFEAIIKQLSAATNKGIKFLFMEHGSFDNQKGGACVIHTHIHIIPGFHDHFNILDNVLPIRSSSYSLQGLAETDFPYILSFLDEENFRIYEAYNTHSQMMRKAICSKLELAEWDWRKNRNESLIEQSKQYWKENFGYGD